jgi:superfamily II DNA or RNA helicase
MIGRILRPSANKDYALIFDFVDSKIGVLKHSGKVRARVYEEQNIKRI